jgi:hypothetical protein
MGNTGDHSNRIPCTFCDKDVIHNPELKEAGNNIGNSSELGRVIMKEHYSNKPIRNHTLSMPDGKGDCAQAHHLICSESVEESVWAKICANFGYNINCKKNGVILPADMRVACQLNIPLHRGNHSATQTTENLNYLRAVVKKIETIKKNALSKKYCDNPDKSIVRDLEKICKEIWDHVKNFRWTLTYDGQDYLTLKGCYGVRSLRQKRKKEKQNITNLNIKKCPDNKIHPDVLINGNFFEEQ